MPSPVRTDNPSAASPRTVTRFGLPGPIWLLGWVSFVTDTASEMIYPLLPLFLTRVLGASAMSLGVIEGAAEAANSVLKIAAGRLSDRTGAPKRIVIAGYALSGAVRPLIALASAWTHVFTLRFTDRLGKGIRTAPRDAMLAHFAPAHLRGRAYGFHRAMDHAGAVTGPLIASAFLFFFPGIIVVLILLRVPEISTARQAPAPSADRGSERPERSVEAPSTGRLHDSRTAARTFRKALVVVFLFSVGNASDAFLLLRMTDLGIAPVWIPLLWSALHVVKVASSVIGGDLSDRYGRRALIAIGWLIYAAVYAGFGLVDSRTAIVAIFLSYGVYFGLTEGVEKAWVADLSSAHARGTAFGAYNAVLGVGSLAASLLSGWIWTHVSPHAAFLTGAALALCASALLYLLFSHEEDSRHQR